jgi:hypothetical protein
MHVYRYAVKAGKAFGGKKEPQSVLKVLRAKVEEMKEDMPLTCALRMLTYADVCR